MRHLRLVHLSGQQYTPRAHGKYPRVGCVRPRVQEQRGTINVLDRPLRPRVLPLHHLHRVVHLDNKHKQIQNARMTATRWKNFRR